MHNLIPRFIRDQFNAKCYRGEFQAASFFVDISGFTSLTETLMRHQKDGAEVLADALDVIFSPLVAEVHCRGGLIPLFAGDAFTALFPFEDAEDQDERIRLSMEAYYASSAIQGFLNIHGGGRSFKTKYGDFCIGVKIGLAVGSVRWSMPRFQNRHAFYFRGEAVDLCAQAEQRAATGEIIADQSFVDVVAHECDIMVSRVDDYYRITPKPLDIRESQSPFQMPQRNDLSPFLPDPILDLAVRAEFRDVAPVFASFEEPESEVTLNRFIEGAIEQADKYGGYLNQVEFGEKGGMLVVLFGAPIAHENSVERAAEFLIALRNHDLSIPFRAGVTFGTVWAGLRGGRARNEYGVIGDVVNLSARLAMSASYSEIRISDNARSRLSKAFNAERVGILALKGKSVRPMVYTLKKRKRHVGYEIFSGSMVGRKKELDQLESAVSRIFQAGFVGVINVYGEAGIGKSRLVHELRRRLESQNSIEWLVCQTDEILRQPLNPFQYLARLYFEQDPDRSESWNRARFEKVHAALSAAVDDTTLVEELNRMKSFLGALVGLRWEGSLYEQVDPKLRFENVLFSFKCFIRALCQNGPVVILVEDLQWLDDESQELLTVLTRSAHDMPFALITASRYRDDGSKPTVSVDMDVSSQEIDLGMLQVSDIHSLAMQILGAGISEELAVFITDKTSGNPFFAEQILLDMREREALRKSDDGTWSRIHDDTDIPSRIGAVLIARLDRLTAEVKNTVQTAAVIGREFEISILSKMLQDRPDVSRTIMMATDERIWNLLSEIRYIFRHALMREAAYDMQLRSRLRDLHHVAAHAIETVYAANLSRHYADLAYHFGKAEIPLEERRYAILAGNQAAERYENREAIRYLSRALELTPDEDTRESVELMLAREKVFDVLGLREEQEKDLLMLDDLAAAHNDVNLKGEVAIRKATYHEATADYAASEKAATSAIDHAHSVASIELEIKGLLKLGVSRWRQGDHKAGRPPLYRALSLTEQVGRLDLKGDVLRALGLLDFNIGDYESARDHYLETLRIYRDEEVRNRSGEGASLLNLGNIGLYQSDYGTARGYYAKALEVFNDIGHRWGLGNVLNNLGLVCENVGEHEDALDHYRRALQIYREIGDRQGEGLAIGNLGNISLYRFDYSEAIDYYQQALRLRRAINDRQGEGMALTNLGVAFAFVGQFTEAQMYFELAETLTREIGDKRVEAYVWVYEGFLDHQMGNQEQAIEACMRAESLAEELETNHIKRMALTHHGRALAAKGSLVEAMEVYEIAIDLALREEQLADSIEASAGLARTALQLGDSERGFDVVNGILDFMEENSLDGNNEPLFIYLTCYEVLHSVGDPRAPDILKNAYRELMRIADGIPDHSMRESYLQNLETNRELIRKRNQLE